MIPNIERAPRVQGVRGIPLSSVIPASLFSWIESYARERGITNSKAGAELLFLGQQAVLKGN